MKDYKQIVKSLIQYSAEEEWFEFKENWFEHHEIGEYISAISNAVALRGKECGYLVWGIDNGTHEIVGTSINYHKDIKKEPFQHYLARLLTPDVFFSFNEIEIEGRRVVVLDIPAAKRTPTSFDGIRYIRIGSSKENVAKYPEREAKLFNVLTNGLSTIESVESQYQDLTFDRLFTYYAGKGITLRPETFEKNLGLLTKDGKYNILAQLLSDDCRMPIRVSLFKGKTKAAPLYSVKEFGNTCILLALERIIDYGDALNIIQADETNRIVERKDVPLFDPDAYREAIINAFVHNKWIDGNAPMITVYSDRIEILSRGTLAPEQTLEGFFLGKSIPVNQKLSDLFLQLHLSERSGRGIPTITRVYGKDAFDFRKNSIVVTIPYTFVKTKTKDTYIVKEQTSAYSAYVSPQMEKVFFEIKKDPHITQPQLAETTGMGKTMIQVYISSLKREGFIERVGSNKTGYWRILK